MDVLPIRFPKQHVMRFCFPKEIEHHEIHKANGGTGLSLPVGKADHIEWDDELPGFGVRLRGGGGRRAWVVQYRVGSQQRRESLGDVRKVRLEDARKVARQRFAQVELGIDPAAERKAARAQAAATKLTTGDRGRALPRRQAGRAAAEHIQAAKQYLPRIGSRCATSPLTPSSGPTSPRGCRRSSRHMVGQRRPGRAAICRRCSPGHARGPVRDEPGHRHQRSG